MHLRNFSQQLGNIISNPLILASGSIIGLLLFVENVLAQTTNENPIKQRAIELIEQQAPRLINLVEERYSDRQAEHLIVIALVLLVLLPLVGFVGALLYPFVNQNKIEAKLPGIKVGSIYRLYFVQACIVGVVILVLGLFLLIAQFLIAAFGVVTNPQVVLETQTINYILDNRVDLVDNYGQVFITVANTLDVTTDTAIASIILNAGLRVRDDGLLHTTVSLVNSMWGLFGYFFIITFSLLILVFIRRIWPDLKKIVNYPVDTILAQRQQQYYSGYAAPPGYYNPAVVNPDTSPWSMAKRLIWSEVKSISLFALLALILAIVTASLLLFFFYPLAGLTVEIISISMVYYTVLDGSSFLILSSVFLLVLFFFECILVLLLSYIFLLGKILDDLRARFSHNLPWKVTMKLMWRYFWRFLRVVLLATVLSIALTIISRQILIALANSSDPNWLLLLITTPVVLLAGLNLGLWLFGGFKSLRKLMRSNVAVDAISLGFTTM